MSYKDHILKCISLNPSEQRWTKLNKVNKDEGHVGINHGILEWGREERNGKGEWKPVSDTLLNQLSALLKAGPVDTNIELSFFFFFFFKQEMLFWRVKKKKKILNSPELADHAAEIRSTCDSYPTYESIWKSTCHPFFARVNTYQARRSLLERRRMMCLPSWLTIAHQLLWGQEDCSQTTGVRESPIWEGDTEFSVASACQLLGSPGMRIYHSL